MISFVKYQGTGNDFILIDNREGLVSLDTTDVARLCDRRFGIGADGLMLLEDAEGYDFRMVYYNSDGNESTMCGNGGRCIAAYARSLGLTAENHTRFVAIDGPHTADFLPDGIVSLHMQDVNGIDHREGYSVLNTGSPHFVLWQNEVDSTNVFAEGKSIRNREEFAPKGINVNFTQRLGDTHLKVRTYERGVEDETYSCGTGVTAASIAAIGAATGDFSVAVTTPGGQLSVSFKKESADTAKDVVLTGPAMFVYEGTIPF